MKVFLITILIFATGVLGCNAEVLDLIYSKIEVLDTAQTQVVYYHKAIDPYFPNPKVDFEMLTIGKNITKYGGYENYQVDSTLMANPTLTFKNIDEYMDWMKNFDLVSPQLITRTADNQIDYYGYFALNYYRYTEPIPEIDWTLCEETENILGHECRKATASWRGREWTAWYADIPINAGPWKFQGLPGLILKLEDASGIHKFEAIGFKDDVFPFGYHPHLYTKKTREKYLAGEKDYCENFGKMISEMNLVQESEEQKKQTRKRRKFYAPIELE